MTGTACGRRWRQVSALAALCCLAGGSPAWAAAVPDVEKQGEEVYDFVQKVAPKLCLACARIDVSAVLPLQNALDVRSRRLPISVGGDKCWLRWSRHPAMYTIYVVGDGSTPAASLPLLQADFQESIPKLMPIFVKELCKDRSKWSFAYIWSIISGKDDLAALGQAKSSDWKVSVAQGYLKASFDKMPQYLVQKLLRTSGSSCAGAVVPLSVQTADVGIASIPYKDMKTQQQENLTLWQFVGKIVAAIPKAQQYCLVPHSVELNLNALPSGIPFRGVLLIAAMLMIAGVGLYKYVYVPAESRNRVGTAGAGGRAGK